jgi:hypothetical protein
MEKIILAKKITEEFIDIHEVKAIAMGGSQTNGILDRHSDVDLYIYAETIVSLSKRKAIVEKLGASKADMNLTFWDTGDEWFDKETGIEIDVMFWSPDWIEGQLGRVLKEHQASMGYTTCFWRTVKNSTILFDRTRWFSELQAKSNQPYPDELKRAIIARNHPVLRTVIPSYYAQIKKALIRRDLISINHRLAAMLASYFDVLFALNEVLHPGEKKIIRFIISECSRFPTDIERKVEHILQLGAGGDVNLLIALDGLIDDLDEILKEEGFDPNNTLSIESMVKYRVAANKACKS